MIRIWIGAVVVLASILAGAGMSRPRPEGRVLRHVVLLKFKDGTTPQQIKQVEDAFRALPSKIDLIRGFEWGSNVSPENLNQGYTHCFLLTFSSDRDRDAYLVDPAHKEFGKILTPYLDKVTVVDYWAQK